MKNERRDRKILYIAAFVGLILFLVGIAVASSTSMQIEKIANPGKNGVIEIHKPILWMSVLATALQTLGAAIIFPVLVSFAYDRLRERILGDEVWRLFAELADAGITRVYRDREKSGNVDNAQARLQQEFRSFKTGEIRMMGPTLRVFFNVQGPFHEDIQEMLKHAQGKVSIKALIERDDNPSVADRTAVEQPKLAPDAVPQTKQDALGTVSRIREITADIGKVILLRRFMQAPYCTAIIFPHVAYFSPNILAPAVPVRLPMILFRSGSHGYEMLCESFNYIWNHNQTVEVSLSTMATAPAPLGASNATQPEATQAQSTATVVVSFQDGSK